MKKIKKVICLIMSITLIFQFIFINNPTSVKALEVPATFAKGADVGWLPQMEYDGFIFKNDKGEEEDCLQILKDHGIDSIRLRTWVNPSDDPQSGHCSAEETVIMAVRAKDMGFKIMIDFHYSDSWADPGQQNIPEAWKNDSLDEMKTHLYDYTHDVMTQLKEAGVTPEWVQVGNEINPGMLLPMGSLTNPSNLAQLINSGYDAVKDVSPTSKVILHRANGYDNDGFRKFFDSLEDYETKYDVIGVSYYPEGDYTASIDALSNNLNDMALRYDKEVMVVEVGGDCSIDDINVHNMVVAVQNKVLQVPDGKGIGVFYWEPQGAKSWSGYSLSAWNGYNGNDNDGKPTKALDAFLPEEVELNPYPVTGIELDKANITVEVGDTVTLNAILTPSNSTYKGVIFSSSDEGIAKVNSSKGIITGIAPGTITITATSYDQHKTATCEVTVVASSNIIKNPSFELDKEEWTVAGNIDSVTFENDSYKGDKALHYYNGDFEVSQTITNLENGSYKLSAWTSGGGGEKTSEIFALNSNGERFSETFTNTSWGIWNQSIINNIEITDGKITIGANVKMSDSGGQWGNIDDFMLVKNDDISLKDLKVDGVTVKKFDSDVNNYDIMLPAGTAEVPSVTATAINSSATVRVIQAAALPGQATVTVTKGSETKTYVINFILEDDNPIQNSGFESSFDNWTISDWYAVSLSNDKHSGEKALGYWKDSDFELTASQEIAGLKNGVYNLSVWSQGDPRSCTNQIFAENSKGKLLSADIKNTGWGLWSKAIIKDIIVTDGTLTIGSYLNAPAEYWGSYDDFELIQTSTVIPDNNKESIKLNKTTDNIKVGETDTLIATVTSSSTTSSAVTWESDDTSIVTVDENGLITGVSEGTAIITASTADGSKTATCRVTVSNIVVSVESIKLNKITETLKKGQSDTLVATINPSNATNKDVKWTSSNNNVVKVDENGKITAVGVGNAIIECIATDGSEKSAICNVTVKKATSSSSSSSNSSSSSTSTNATSSVTGTTTTSTETTDIKVHQVSIANMTKEEVKAIEGKVITNMSAMLGESATIGEVKEIIGLDGKKLSITTMIKNGKNAGTVITAEESSSLATIPLDKEGLPVVAVYKYVPLLEKYIQLTDGIVMGTDTITLPTQANATYVVATSEIPAMEAITQGWVKISNNWYMVNVTGDPQVGWQKDSIGWVYLSPENAVMQTSWKMDGGIWYYLKDNGYMATGWIKDGSNWYYCNENGSMALNTAVDGYKLGQNGAWIN